MGLVLPHDFAFGKVRMTTRYLVLGIGIVEDTVGSKGHG